ncbi:50S ribosomal protein L15e [Candidatus Woesearchaeota archaeon]|nr:MAG: 50S ribosomal protein L15e [Candidatus Woesearchaeota archaeon]
MGMYHYIRKLWKRPKDNLGDIWRERLVKWRREPATVRIARPTRIDRARELGYRAKPGFIVVRQRIKRGGKQRPNDRRGRRPKHNRLKLVLAKSYQQVAEERANRMYPNLEVLNSYYVAEDGNYYWYEVILVDRDHPAVINDKRISWIFKAQHTRRAFRGLTSAGKKSRGLRNKGKGAEKARPSNRAKGRKIK